MATRYVNRIGVLSLGKILAVVYGTLGLIFGILITSTSLLIGPGMYGSGSGGMLFGAAAVITLPVFYGIIGFVSGVITAWIFNAATGVIGGLEIEVE